MSLHEHRHYGNHVAELLARLEGVKRCGEGWLACCPAHDDARPSLSVGVGDDGKVLLHCFAGCPTEAVLGSLGLAWRDLFPPKDRRDTPRTRAGSSPPPPDRPFWDPQELAIYQFLTGRDSLSIRQLQVLLVDPETPADRRQAIDQEIHRQIAQLPRKRGCGICKGMVNPQTGKGFGCKVRCRRYSCPYCAELNRHNWLVHLAGKINDASALMAWNVFPENEAALLARLRRKKRNYFRVRGPGSCWIVAETDDPAGSFAGEEGMDWKRHLLQHLVVELHGLQPSRKPVTTSRAWAMARRKEQEQEDREPYTHSLRIPNYRHFLEVLREVGAKTRSADLVPGDAREAGVSFVLPPVYRNEDCVRNLQGWLDCHQLPPGGDLRVRPPRPSWSCGAVGPKDELAQRKAAVEALRRFDDDAHPWVA